MVDGLGKSLEISDLGTGGDQLVRTAFVLGTTTPVTWVSVSGVPKLLTSAAEYKVQLNLNRQIDDSSRRSRPAARSRSSSATTAPPVS